MDRNGKSLLVTGGCGFIGSSLVRLALARGYEILNLDKLTYAGNLFSMADVHSGFYSFLQTDICDLPLVLEAFDRFKPAGVLHLAAESHVDRSIDDPGAFVRTNIVGTHSLLQAALLYWTSLPEADRKDFRFLHVSTDEVFGSLGPEGVFHESSRYAPRSPYAASKAASDHLVRAYGHTYGLPVLITNCSNNFGPRQFPEKLIPLAINRSIREKPIPVYGDGRQVRDWIHVGDHCDALLRVLENGRTGETYLIGGHAERSNLDVIRETCALLDELHPRENGRRHFDLVEFVPDRPGHDRRYAMDTSKMETEIGWKPAKSFQAGLRQTVEWYLSNQAWVEEILSGPISLERLGRAKGEAIS
ncbi:MAG: dTDP-glucose 4,6-dehydratase [Synergistales bacterium]